MYPAMRPSRRRILGLALAAGLLTRARGLLAAAAGRRTDDSHLRALAPYLDTLLPADRWSPSATGLAIDDRFKEKAARDPGYRRLLVHGCRMLDRVARRLGGSDFAALPESKREALVAFLEVTPPESAPRRFFETTRRDAFLHYYTRPESWAGLGYDGPPQPAGFPDHEAPPKALR